ncbi:MAG: hypothetical protein JOZ78_11445 [Chroococcidiopsidaceae cyanobacterium CP_BM_ER_R8_30]|nr:hypothetical protein [Chroococcidiopsidaceae cyanobacterium CP_BM_ER_R8_30]
MNKIVQLLKKIQLRQILTAFMAGALLVISTACSGSVEAQTPPAAGLRQDVPAGLEAVPGKNNPRPEVPEKAETNRFKGSSMNEFSDVDPRAKETEKAAQAKAEALRENAERNINETGENLPDKVIRNYQGGTPLGERVQQLGEDVGSSAQELKEGVYKGTKRGIENIKENTLDAAKGVKQGTARTVDANTPDASNLTRRAQQTAKDALNKAGNAINDAVD